MALLGTLLKSSIKLKDLPIGRNTDSDAVKQSYNTLKKLITKAVDTEFGKKYNFEKLLRTSNRNEISFMQNFAEEVPLHDYNKMYSDWWIKSLDGKESVTWPGKVKYFALSSGTSEASSKRIPVTKSMLLAMRKVGVRQLLSLGRYKGLNPNFFEKQILALSGSTNLAAKGQYLEGDLSGITAGRLPFWLHPFYKPGKKISQVADWSNKLDMISDNAASWDVGMIVGVPAWTQLLIEKILQQHNKSSIHEIWPNLEVFIHGGVAFDPYRSSFQKIVGKPLIYLETYLASEGFIAFQDMPDAKGMRLVLDQGLYYEFIPFKPENFDVDGLPVSGAKVYHIGQLAEGEEYALLLSTCAGAWRYLIGDVVKVTNLKPVRIVITGRTKHFLSLCGEHLSVDNMTKAVLLTADKFKTDIREFTVCGVPSGNMFAHEWYLGIDGDSTSMNELAIELDGHLKQLNDDYAVERKAALKEIIVHKVPLRAFYDWMKIIGMEGAQRKFPRVLKDKQHAAWKEFLKSSNYI